MTPEHIHVAINHIPIIGTGLAIIPILAGYFLKNKGLLITGLVLAAGTSWLIPVIMETGEESYERYEEGPVRAYLDANFDHYMEIHEERAETWSIAIYATAVLSTLGIIVCFWKWNIGRTFSLFICLSCLVTVGSGIWIADAGGKIRRVDFRDASSSVQEKDHHSHEHDADD